MIGLSERSLRGCGWRFGLCAVMGGVGTAMASPTILLLLVPIAGLAALFPIHPFDLIYNYGIRFITKTAPLPRRGAPSRLSLGFHPGARPRGSVTPNRPAADEGAPALAGAQAKKKPHREIAVRLDLPLSETHS